MVKIIIVQSHVTHKAERNANGKERDEEGEGAGERMEWKPVKRKLSEKEVLSITQSPTHMLVLRLTLSAH